MSTTDFTLWMDFYIDSNEYGEIFSLYQAIMHKDSDIGTPVWDITIKGDQTFVKPAHGGETLALLSEKAIETFLSMLDERYGHGIGVELWADCQRAADNTP